MDVNRDTHDRRDTSAPGAADYDAFALSAIGIYTGSLGHLRSLELAAECTERWAKQMEGQARAHAPRYGGEAVIRLQDASREAERAAEFFRAILQTVEPTPDA